MKRALTLSGRLILALVVPAFLVLAVIASQADQAMSRALEDELGARLVSIASAAAVSLDPRVLLLERGDDELKTATFARRELVRLAEATGAARIEVLRLDAGPPSVLLDSLGERKIGQEFVRAEFDRAELERVARGESASSILFRDASGGWFKSGYAPVYEDPAGDAPRSVRGAIVAHAPAGFFAVLRELRGVLIAIVGVGFLALIALAFVASRGVTTSLSELSHAAERIGAGELGAEVPVGGPREVRVLSETMRTMARSILKREEEMQVMLAGIAHEVRNPLGGIELFGGLLREDLEADPRQKHVDRILKEIGVLGGVVSDFLDYARKRPLEKARIDLLELAEEIASVSQREAEAKQVRIGVEVERGLGAELDRDSIRRALLNLVKNAVQAAPENGRVAIRARPAPGGAVELEVADDGPGIPPEKREEVFRPFFTTKQKGTGLGLALVKKAVDAHGGTVRIEDHAGGGARFVLTLPSSVEP